jgi:hypothetical protein
MNNTNNINKKEEYTDGKYSVYSFLSNDKKSRRIVCSEESIIILPFDLNQHNNINNLYLKKYDDYLSNKSDFTCISKTFDKNEFSSHYDSIEALVSSELGISNLNINDIYYLGVVKHGLPFTKEYRCCAIDLTQYQDDPTGFSIDREIHENQNNTIEKIKFSKILSGEIKDSLALSCSILLLSQFSK